MNPTHDRGVARGHRRPVMPSTLSAARPQAGPVGEFCATLRTRGGHVSVALSGELDLCSVPGLRATMAAAGLVGHGHVAVDLADVSFIDASAVCVLAGTDDHLRGEDLPGLVVTGASGIVRHVFDLCGLGYLLEQGQPPWAGAVVDLSL